MTISDAFLAAVRAAVPGRQVWDGQVLENSALADYDHIDRDGYVVVYCPEGDTLLSNVGGAVDGKTVVPRIHSFGPTRQSARWLSNAVTDYVISHGVDVPGFGHGDVAEHYNRPPVADNDVREFPVVMVYDEFHMLFARTA